jgi:uncharacterized DUF497 family protein
LNLLIASSVAQKIRQKHNISVGEVEECFYNRTHSFLIDSREEHKTDPPTQWFLAKTDLGKTLKVCFIVNSGEISIKTAFSVDNQDLIEMYYRKANEE